MAPKLFSTCVLLAALVITSGHLAGADPAGRDPGCRYDLSAPQVTQVSATAMVTVSVTPIACDGIASPNRMTACVATPIDLAGRCTEITGFRTATVFYPYRAGVSYRATGRGCAAVYAPSSVSCDALGPLTTTL